MKYDKHEDGIDLLVLIKFLLRKWKSIVLIAIVGLIIGSVYIVFDSRSTQEASTETASKEEDLAYSIAKNNYATTLDRVEVLEQDLLHSAIMEINPYSLYKGTLSYVVEVAPDKLIELNASVNSFVWEGELLEDLETVGPYTQEEAEKLLSLSLTDNGALLVEGTDVLQANFKIGMMAKDESEAQKIMEQIAVSTNEFFTVLLEEQDIIAYDEIDYNIKRTIVENLAAYQTSLRTNYETELTSLNKYKDILDSYEPVNNESAEGNISRGAVIKYASLGLVVGGCLSILIWILIFVFGNRVYSVQNKKKLFEIEPLGNIYEFERKNIIDKYVARCVNGVYSDLSVDEQKKLLLFNIRNRLRNDSSVKSIYIVNESDKTIHIATDLVERLKEDGYVTGGCESILGKVELLQNIKEYDAIILVESNTAKIDIVLEEINVLKAYDKKILGMVLVQNKL